MNNIGLLWRTIRHLTLRQILYQLLNRSRGRARLRLPKTAPTGHFLAVPEADKPVSWVDGTATFLNQSVSFSSFPETNLNWNYAGKGKLWTYNLNYFDFLNQSGMTRETGLVFIQDFIAQTDTLKAGLEPYPTSLRIINWVQFLSRHHLQDDMTDAHLFAQVDLVSRRLEYHLAGNHLLKNSFALLMGAMYFRQISWFRTAEKILRAELSRQILVDGAHDERSPMYHQIVLDRLLDVVLALRHNPWQANSGLADWLVEKACHMLTWLESVTFRNGDVPMVNDAVWRVAPSTADLRTRLAGAVGAGVGVSRWCSVPPHHRDTGSGYRMFRHERYELFVDTGAVGPDHQPGHGHADSLSFVLYVDNCPIIVDTGTSTYEIGPRRAWERSTAAHNTVEVEGQSSSEVWAGFRVGRRARTTVSEASETRWTASHDGYRRLGIIHQRTWVNKPMEISILDRLIAAESTAGVARFYFHPGVSVTLTGHCVLAGPLQLSFVSDTVPEIKLVDCDIANGFNQLGTSQCLEVLFVTSVETILIPTA